MKTASTTLLLLALCTTGVASAQSTDYTLRGWDLPRGSMTGSLRLRHNADRTYAVTYQGYFTNGDERLHANLKESGGAIVGTITSRAGMVGRFSGAPRREIALVSISVDPVRGLVRGSVSTPRGVSFFSGERDVAIPRTGYTALSAEDKQAALWAEASAHPYGDLPDLGSAGIGTGVWDTVRAMTPSVLDKTFAANSDVREARTKLFHPFGSVACVTYTPVGNHAYTGVFKTGAVGMVRLSLALDDKTYIPGVGLKLLVDGAPSVNAHAIPSFDDQRSRDFFLRAPSNVIPEPSSLPIKLFVRIARQVTPNPLHRSVEVLSKVERDGTPVSRPVAPHQILFEPADVHFAADAEEDFRDLLETIPPGTRIYTVVARTPGGDQTIGELRTTSRFVASAWGDQVFHFKHAR